VHEMLFSFCATYSPELPLCFSMKPRRAPCGGVAVHSPVPTRAVCNGLSNPRKKSRLHALLSVPPREGRRHPSPTSSLALAIKENGARRSSRDGRETGNDGESRRVRRCLLNYGIAAAIAARPAQLHLPSQISVIAVSLLSPFP
jgi:hypothetical protein